MLLDEDPATVRSCSPSHCPQTSTNIPQLIHHTLTNFNITPDKSALARVNDSLSTLQQSRTLRIRDAETALRKLSRSLATLSSQHKEMVSGHDSSRHASEIVELDTRKFRVAKQAQELEVEGERLEGDLETLKARLAELEEQGVEGDMVARRGREADDPTM
jgi:kinetochore protein Spc24, fungi type